MFAHLAAQGLKPKTTYCYGAIEVDPKYLTIHILFETTSELEKAQRIPGLIDNCFELLAQAGYPKGKSQGVHIGFESIQRINEQANGNWYHYFK